MQTEFLDNRTQVLLVDLHKQSVIGVLHHSLHVGLQVAPSHIAPPLKQQGEVTLLIVVFDHLGIEAREEEDIIDECQQFACVLLDLLCEDGLVLFVMLTVVEFCKTDDCIQRGAQLVAHVQQEHILQALLLLGFLCLFLQLLLGIGHLGLVTAHTEVMGDFSVSVSDGHHVEVQVDAATLFIAHDGTYRL